MFALKLSARLDQAQLSRRLDAGECIMKFIADLDPTQSVWKALRHNAAELLRIFAADALFLRGPEGVTLHGTSLSSDDLGPAIARLEEAAAKDDVVSSSSLCKLHDDARRYALEVSGALYVRLSLSETHCLVILRREQSASVKWAGNPNKAALADSGKGRLSPRASFAAWEEITHCESSRWSAGDLDKAAILRELG
jgi:light-regulated signal transduction histidine kinase (bacteriophytochrome)